MPDSTAIDPITNLPLPSGPIRFNDYTQARVPWLWKYWLARESVTLLSAPGGSGKGSLTVQMCLSAIGALNIWPDGTPTPPQGEHAAMLLSYEDNITEKVIPRVRALGWTDPQSTRHLYVSPNMRELGVFDQMTQLLSVDRPGEPHFGLIVIDPLSNVAGREGVNENDNSQMTKLMDRFAQIAEEEQVAILLVHHDRKGGVLDGGRLQDGTRGASAIANSARLYWGLIADPAGDPDIRFLGKMKSNSGPVSGVIEYRMKHWEDRDDKEIETGFLKVAGYRKDVTLDEVIKERKQQQRESVADVLSKDLLEYLRQPTTTLPILQSSLRIVFDVPSDKQFHTAIKILKTDGAIGHHPLTKTEAKQLRWRWKPNQYVISVLGVPVG